MAIITSIDGAACVRIREILNADLAPIGAANGLAFKAGHMTYTTDGKFATVKLEVSVLQPDGTPLLREQEDFRKYASAYGLRDSDLGRSFVHRGKPFTILGLRIARTVKVTAADPAGAEFLFPVESVKRALQITGPGTGVPSL